MGVSVWYKGSGQRLPTPLHLSQAFADNPLHQNCYVFTKPNILTEILASTFLSIDTLF
jgi:hypothetical protein